MQPIESGTFIWSEKDKDYYLQHSRYKYIPLSPLQRTKINSALGNRQNATQYLSPKQQHWLNKNERNIVLSDTDFPIAWTKRNGY